MTVFPLETPLTKPDESTVATDWFAELHSIPEADEAPEIKIVALSFSFVPRLIPKKFLSMIILFSLNKSSAKKGFILDLELSCHNNLCTSGLAKQALAVICVTISNNRNK